MFKLPNNKLLTVHLHNSIIILFFNTLFGSLNHFGQNVSHLVHSIMSSILFVIISRFGHDTEKTPKNNIMHSILFVIMSRFGQDTEKTPKNNVYTHLFSSFYV